MVCGKEEQNVRRREEEVKRWGMWRQKRTPLQWCAEPRLCYCMWRLDLPVSLPDSGTLCREFPKIMAIQGSRNTHANYHQGEISGSVEQIFPYEHNTHDHIKRAKNCLYWSCCGLLCSQGLWEIKWKRYRRGNRGHITELEVFGEYSHKNIEYSKSKWIPEKILSNVIYLLLLWISNIKSTGWAF